VAALPDYQPELAMLVESPPEGDGWLHEVKFDGYRIGCRIERGAVALIRAQGPAPAAHGRCAPRLGPWSSVNFIGQFVANRKRPA